MSHSRVRADVFETLIRERSAATPDGTAVLEDGGLSTTYAELDERASRTANALVAAGIESGDRVAFVGENSTAFLATLFGAAKCGAVLVAVNHRLSPAEVDYILRDARPAALVLGRGHEGLATTGLDAGVPLVVTVEPSDGATAYAAWIDAADPTDPGLTRDRADTALILYSSGTTGRPKGVQLAGRGLDLSVAALDPDVRMREDSVALIAGPFFHVGGLVLGLLAVAGGSTMLLKRYATPGELLALLEEHRVTHAGAVPSLIQFMLAHPLARTGDWSALEVMSYGASPMPEPALREATAVFGCRFMQSYGLTETSGAVAMLTPADHHISPGTAGRLRSAGRPIPGAEVRVVDTVTLVDAPVGGRGEVWMRGEGIMNGYWSDPRATEDATVDGWFRSGDIGSLDADGYIYLHDRLKDMVVSGGENVYPAEVESVLTGHPGIAQVAVIGVGSERWGEVPYAVVVRAPGSEATEQEIIAWTRERLAHYKAPSGVAFVDALPMNATGKVLKQPLREQYAG